MSRPPREFAVRLAWIAAAAFAIRLVYVATVGHRNPGGGDPLYYHVQANLLADGHGFAEPFRWLREQRVVPSAVHPPLFTVLLAAASVVGGTGFAAHKVMAMLAGTAVVVVIGLVARSLAGDRAGLLAAGVAAVYPNLWVIDGILMPEGLFALTIGLVLLAAYWFERVPRVGRAIMLGGAIGLATLTRPEALALVAFLAVPLTLTARRMPVRDRLRALGATALACALVLAPWTVRNLVRFDAPVFLSVNGDEVVRNANCDLTWRGELLGFWAIGCYEARPPAGFDEAERGRWWRKRGLDYVGDHWDRVPVVAAARAGRVWDVWRPVQNTRLSTIEGRNVHVNRAGLASYYLLIPVAASGAVLLRRARVRLLPLLTMPVLVTLTAVLAYGAVRFRVPAEVTLVVLAGIGLDKLLRRRTRSEQTMSTVG